MASPTQIQAVGSMVPTQSKRSWNATRPWPGRIVAVTDGGRLNPLLLALPDIEEAGPLGSAKPLVAVARVVGGTQCIQIEGQHPGRMGAVHQRVDAAFLKGADDPGRWEK